MLRRYIHLGTGNYNVATARTYTDLGLMTVDEDIAADVTDVFNYLTGYSAQTEYRKLLVAPLTLRSAVVDLIRTEAVQPDPRIVMKINALADPENVREFRVPGARLLPPIVPISLLEHRWILGPDDRLPWPPGSEEVDYQVEVACIVGQFCRDVSLDDAPDLIFGYTVMNDWVGRTGRAATRGRSHRPRVDRFATSLGPCVVTADEFDPARGRLVARVDGDVWSEGDLGSAQGTFPQLLAQFSAQQDMYPGDVLGSGTFPGGCATDLGRWRRHPRRRGGGGKTRMRDGRSGARGRAPARAAASSPCASGPWPV